MSKPSEESGLSRRALLSGSVALVPLLATSCSSTTSSASSPRVVDSVFTVQERATLQALVDRLLPADEFSPAASECGVLDYFDRCLSEWNQGDVPLLRAAVAALQAQALERGGEFATLDVDTQDALLVAMEAGQFPAAAGQAGFNRLLRLTLEGMFSDPYYGGNRHYAGWDLIGYPGAVPAATPPMQAMGGRLPALHTSAYGAEHDGH
ncbi:MAG: gluconate 2-dehydrogenase subunit 3 family protein [Pseudomonadales bacterium]|jgi:hypothetical protein|nr:gluconate 2-dehydrogenase subunit 3 family protein [Pseudomonadales bacterium]